MTIIAYKDGVLASDSCSFSGGIRYAALRPKVIFCAVGLVGAAGRKSDAEAYKAWMAAGMLPDAKPELLRDKDDGLQGLWVKHDRTLWWTDERLTFVQIEAPGSIGEPEACAFVDGAMWSGASADEAVRLAIEHCVYTGGAVQVVRLDGVQSPYDRGVPLPRAVA